MLRSAAIRSVALAVAGAWSEGATASAPSPLSDWARGDGKARVRIQPCDRGRFITNTWISTGTPNGKANDQLHIGSVAGVRIVGSRLGLATATDLFHSLGGQTANHHNRGRLARGVALQVDNSGPDRRRALAVAGPQQEGIL